MHKRTKIFILALLSVMTITTIDANNPSTNYEINQNYGPDQRFYDQDNDNNQNSSDLRGERAFMTQSRNRMNQMQQSNRNMIKQDRRMMREGFDANESQYKSNVNLPQQHDLNNPIRNQEQRMQGIER